MTRQIQINTANQLLAQNLSRLSFEQLVNLCLIKKANPTALPSFGRSLQSEIIRRYDKRAIVANPDQFAVLQNFANAFADPVGEFEYALRTMHSQINKDVWFTNNQGQFVRIINDSIGVRFLLENQEILKACMDNAIARPLVLESPLLVEAMVVNAAAFERLITTASWDELTASANVMQIFAKSSQIIDRIIATPAALRALVNSSTAMQAVAGSSTAMQAVAGSSTAMQAVAGSSTAMQAVVNSSNARAFFIANNSNFQAVRNTLYRTVKANWTKHAHTYQDFVSSANNPMAQKTGLVFACLGYWGNSGTTSMYHANDTLAAAAGTTAQPSTMQSLDGVSFDKATFTESGDGYVYCELWVPRA